MCRYTSVSRPAWRCSLVISSRTALPRQVNTSSVVLRKLMEGREDSEGLLTGSADVAARWASSLEQRCSALLFLQPCLLAFP